MPHKGQGITMANKQGSKRKKFEDLRVPMTMTVKPATRSLLDSWGNSRGVTVDNLVEAHKAKLDYDSKG